MTFSPGALGAEEEEEDKQSKQAAPRARVLTKSTSLAGGARWRRCLPLVRILAIASTATTANDSCSAAACKLVLLLASCTSDSFPRPERTSQ